MEIADDEILKGIAAGGPMDYSRWPALLPRVIARVEKIAHEEFPIPNLPPAPPLLPLSSATTVPSSIPRPPGSESPEHVLVPLPSSPTDPNLSGSTLSDANKENDPAAPQTTAPPPPLPNSAPAPSDPLPPGTLPSQLAVMLCGIVSYLNSTFPTYPPHTIQRISELVINPKQHYRSLATYLHALDRVVRVTSGLNVYPLPLTNMPAPGGLANGVLETPSRPSPWASPGSDEALGGALLTPIPWISHNQRPGASSSILSAQGSQPQQVQPTASSQEIPTEFEGEVRTESTERIDGPNGVGSIETVSVSVNGIPSMGARGVSVTQGELLRQEQEAGLVPVSQLIPSHHIQSGSSSSAAAQQQIQARIHQRRALAQSHSQVGASPSAESSDSPSSASGIVSTPSSATLEGESVDAAADNLLGAIGPIHSNNADDEDKPHACGPEEIGADDLGPQTATSSTLPTSTTAGTVTQGIDIQAAVGRKPLDSLTLSTREEVVEDNPGDGGKMDVDENGRGIRLSTPKRDAEDELGGATSKKLKEDSSPASDDTGSKTINAESKTEDDSNDRDAMEKD